jgi:hypothetical protein
MRIDSTRKLLTPQGRPQARAEAEPGSPKPTMSPKCLHLGLTFLYYGVAGFGLKPKEVGQS